MTKPIVQESVRNRLLRRLSADDFARLAPDLVAVDLPVRTVLETPGEVVENVVFLEAGIGSVIVSVPSAETEAGHIGYEGVTGISVVLGSGVAMNRTLIQVAGKGYRMSSSRLASALKESEGLRSLLLLYVQTLHLQVAHSVLAAARFTIEQRLARWLLMCHDRVGAADLPLTHEFMALMLSVRRAGVTHEIHILEGLGAIKASRGNVRVLDRRKLQDIAAGCYGVPEKEYDRLIG